MVIEEEGGVKRGMLLDGIGGPLDVLKTSLEEITPQPYKPINRISPIGLSILFCNNATIKWIFEAIQNAYLYTDL